MTIAEGVSKKVVIALQPAKGTQAKATSPTATYTRRTTSTLDVKKETYQSSEIREDQQIADFRHGVKDVDGSITKDLAPGSSVHEIPAILRQSWQNGSTSGAHTDVTAAVTSGYAGTFTTVAGTFMTDGLKVGDVIRWTGWTGSATSNNTKNFLITALTEKIMTVFSLNKTAVVAKASGDSVTATVIGRKTWVPSSGHSDKYFTIEHYFSDLDLSEVFLDCKPSQVTLRLPPTGIATVEAQWMGLDNTEYSGGSAPYFTNPTASSTGGSLASVNGALFIDGTQVALLTGLDVTINGNVTGADAVVGSNIRPDLFQGRVNVTGNATVYFDSETYRNYFLNETEVSIVAAFTTGSDANADFIAITMSRVKVGGSGKDDGEKGLVQTMPFQALLDTAGGAALANLYTTISIQDSLAASFAAATTTTTTTTTTSSTTTTTA